MRQDGRNACRMTGASAGGFIDRYVFPDGELTGSGRIISEAQDIGLEVVHAENLRHHYALTLRDWCANLVEHWDEAVEEVGLPTAKVWGCTWPDHGSASSRMWFSCTRFLRSSSMPRAATAGCPCARGGRPSGQRGSPVYANQRFSASGCPNSCPTPPDMG